MDRDLRRALGRRDPSSGFADRVFASLPEERRSGPGRRDWSVRNLVAWLALGAAASILILIGGARSWNRQQETRESERVTRDLEIALRITSDTLNDIQVRLAGVAMTRGAQDEHHEHR
jgi:hypothetical protein